MRLAFVVVGDKSQN